MKENTPGLGNHDPDEDPANGIYVDNSKGINTGVTISNRQPLEQQQQRYRRGSVPSGLITLKGMDLNDSGAGGLIAVNSGAPVLRPA